MKREIVGFFIILLLICNVSALSTNLKDNYVRAETVIVELNGVVGSLSEEQIEFKREHIRIGAEYGLEKMNDRYYLWFISFENEGNYSLIINNVDTTVLGKVTNIDYIENFTVKGNFTDYNVNPGAIFVQDSFDVVVNSFKDENFEIDVDFPAKGKIKLTPGENKINFDVDSIEGDKFLTINIGKYAIPSFIKGDKKNNSVSDDLRFSPSKISAELYENETKSYIIKLINEGNKTKEIELDYNKTLFTIKESKFSIKSNASYEFNLTINKVNRGFDKDIIAMFGNDSENLNINVKLLYIDKNLTGTNGYKCFELNGKVCKASEQCNGQIKNSLDGACCIGICEISEDKSNGGLGWVGWLLFILIIGILGYLVYKYKGVKPNTDFFKKKTD